MSENTTRSNSEILMAARERIADPTHFVRGATAWDRRGHGCLPDSPDAWRWDANGALKAESGQSIPAPKSSPSRTSVFWFLYTAAADLYTGKLLEATPSEVVDRFGHSETLRMYDEAISLAREAERGFTATAAPAADAGRGGA